MHTAKAHLLIFALSLVSIVNGQNLPSLQQSARSGDVTAMMKLGVLYHKGEGVAKSPVIAFNWMMKAAEMGHPDAMYSVALMYSRGLGVMKSVRESATWITKAANLGHAHAQNVLATLYATGNGVIKSFPEAFKWRRQAALSGLASAQMAMANSFKSGDIIGGDLLRAYAWFNIAEVSGVANAKANRESIGNRLNPEQLVQAQNLSRQIVQQISSVPPPLPSIHGGEVMGMDSINNKAPGILANGQGATGLPGYLPPTGSPSSTSKANLPSNTFLPSGLARKVADIDLEMLWVRPGSFIMGSPLSEPHREDDERQHTVTLTRGFWLGKYEVTQNQWEKVMGNNPSKFKGADLPVQGISWVDAMMFCKRLGLAETKADLIPGGYEYRLPTEAEWEYACRAGTTTAYAFGGSLTPNSANFGKILGQPSRVGTFPANAWGFHDMHGNQFEFCYDWYGSYAESALSDPVGPGTGTDRVKRGGVWIFDNFHCRSAGRSRNPPNYSSSGLGFRVALGMAIK